MSKQKPGRKEQLIDAVRSGSIMAFASLFLLFPAALLIGQGIMPENKAPLSAIVAAFLSALLTELCVFGKRREGYIYLPLSAVIASLILLLLGACIAAESWNFGCIFEATAAMTIGMSVIYFIKINKNNKKPQKRRKPYYK